MAETLGTGAGKVNLTFQIGSVQYRTIAFFSDAANTIPLSVATWTFEFYIKRFVGDRLKIIDLTLGNGISFVTYLDTSIQITITGAQSSIEEGEYYWELRRTDLNIPLMSGEAYFKYDS